MGREIFLATENTASTDGHTRPSPNNDVIPETREA
jgi:hypothetical protein